MRVALRNELKAISSCTKTANKLMASKKRKALTSQLRVLGPPLQSIKLLEASLRELLQGDTATKIQLSQESMLLR